MKITNYLIFHVFLKEGKGQNLVSEAHSEGVIQVSLEKKKKDLG